LSRFSWWPVGLAAWLVVAATCAVPAAEGSPQEEEVRRRLAELERHRRVSEVEIARLRQEIARLERELAAAREEAELARREADQARAAALREPEEGFVPSAATVEESDVPDEELELRDAAPAADVVPAPSADAATADVVTAEAREIYDASYTLFHERRYGEAAAGFARFLKLHPQTSLSDNAQFWIGECHYARGDYDAALSAFMATVERYPSGNKVADALLKAGKSLEALGDRDGAVDTYREIERRFEGSVTATMARERLAALEAGD
jgi:tol-pal system protein YbgF